MAGFVNLILRSCYLPPNTIQLLPADSFRQRRAVSHQSLLWLFYLSRKYGYVIRHGHNNIRGEKRIMRYKIDGYEEKDGIKTCYEFHDKSYLIHIIRLVVLMKLFLYVVDFTVTPACHKIS